MLVTGLNVSWPDCEVDWSCWCGVVLLEDIAGVAASMYGRGTAEKAIINGPLLDTSLNLCLVAWWVPHIVLQLSLVTL